MSRYLHRFTTEAEFQEYRENNYNEPWVSYTNNVDRVNYNKSKEEKFLPIPLTFEIQSDGDIKWVFTNTTNGEAKTLEYKKNDGEWTEITSTTGGTSIPVVSGDTVQFRGDNTTISYSSATVYYRNEFSGTTCSFAVKGNIMSLLDKDDFVNKTSFDSDYVFMVLFNHCHNLTDASDLMLPATTLTDYCYYAMFQYCTNLTTVPKLPATTLKNRCYYRMFSRCTSLTQTPELPATTLAEGCYSYMFYNCTSLTTAPKLPATNLSGCNNCYDNMFAGCTGLTTAPKLPATTLAEYCYRSMFIGCTSLTTAPELPATLLADRCYQHMFNSCTSLTTAPELPATTLDLRCYESMFSGCTNLTTAPALPATTLANSCYLSMFQNCTSLTSAPELPATTLTPGCYATMFKDCTNLNYIKCLATDISATDSTNNWVYGVAASGTFVKDSNMPVGTGGWTTGNSGIPTGWTVQNAT